MNKTIKHGLAGAILGGALMAGDTSQAEGFSFTEIQVHQGDGYLLGRNGFNETARTTVTLEHFSAGYIGELFFSSISSRITMALRPTPRATSMARSTPS